MTFQYFFTYKDQLPNNIGVGTFTPLHLSILTVFFILIYLGIRYFKNKEANLRHRFLLITAFLIPALELIRILWVISLGIEELIPSALLPFQLCGLMSVFVPWAVITRKPILLELVYVGGIAGAGMALLTPDCTMYPLLNIQFIQSMLIHGLIFFAGWYLILVEKYRPSIKNLPKLIGVMTILALFVTPFNLMLQHQQANYFFLMSGLEGTILETLNANNSQLIYLVYFTLLVISFLILLYLPWTIKLKTRKA
ncbi:MAG: TIGR02206 family membrane protein [Firmicutes bacterium HGW-Firmicutes-20]|jgi:hypothetical integral membrane protein (TIGR02206 family)|nr:MAG: TIGR02206 family membrane protein [Firmicutes bacterium HGW-Firmicutes-20]PKM68950.1 MAG: TIGR02206 family membrane protein [Firmicutes bacterium HGW-Firmicutes-19]